MEHIKRSLYLGISTTEKETGIAIAENRKVLYELIEETDAHHNETIFTFLDNAFQSLNLSPNQINGIGVVIGPGMFTSLRVGLACAKGLAVVNNIPIKGFYTLDALVLSLPNSWLKENRIIIPSIDVRRNEIYFRIYKGFKPVTEPLLAKPDVFAQKITSDAIVLGSGIHQYLELIKKHTSTNFIIHNLIHPQPSSIALYAAECISKKDVSDIATLVPFYVR